MINHRVLRQILLGVALACSALVLTGCTSTSGDIMGSWSLESFENPNAPILPPPGATRPTLTIAPAPEDLKRHPGDLQISGFGGVNRFFGPARRGRGDTLAVSSLGVTRMAGPSPLLAVERVYIGLLQSARSASVKDGVLTIRGDSGGAVFRPLDEMIEFDEGTPPPGEPER